MTQWKVYSLSIVDSHNWSLIERFYREILLSVRLHLIYSHFMDCTEVPWESLTSMVISIAVVKVFHQWPIIKWFLPCSTSTPIIAWLDSYLWKMGLKTLDLIILVQVAMEYLWFVLTHRSTLRVTWLCPNLSLLTHRSTMYFWWLCSDLSRVGMDPQCMFGGHDLSYLTWIFTCRHLCSDSFVFWVWESIPRWWCIIVLHFLVCR